jgi:hypothetical protein
MPERLRPVPKGHWKLAGGASHRCVTNINPSPGPGRRKSRDYIASPLPGLVISCVRNRWFAPPANVRDASGVLMRLLSSGSGLKNQAHCHRFHQPQCRRTGLYSLFLQLAQVLLRLHRRGAARAGGGHGLLINAIGHIARNENAGMFTFRKMPDE